MIGIRILEKPSMLSRQVFRSIRSVYSYKPIGLHHRTIYTPARPSLLKPLHRNAASGARQTAQQYGTLAVGVYLTLSFTTFCCCLSSIYFLGVTQESVSKVFARIYNLLGMDKKKKDVDVELDEEKPGVLQRLFKVLPEGLKTPGVVQTATNILLAMAMTKLLTPIKLGITAAVVPSIAKYLRSMGYIKTIVKKP